MTLPLLDDDLGADGIIEPSRVIRRRDLPGVAVACFFAEVVDALAARPEARQVARLRSEAGEVPVWRIEVDGRPLTVFHPGVGAPLAAAFVEEMIAMGIQRLIACGAAGALVPELVVGHAVIVDSAVRDEGTSFHYLPPGRVVEADPGIVATLRATIEDAGAALLVGRTWTTDAIYRETRSRAERRIDEGCVVVEMEASALIAVCRYRRIAFGQVLMAGDSLAGADWEHRGWTTAAQARAEIFWLAARAALAVE